MPKGLFRCGLGSRGNGQRAASAVNLTAFMSLKGMGPYSLLYLSHSITTNVPVMLSTFDDTKYAIGNNSPEPPEAHGYDVPELSPRPRTVYGGASTGPEL
jgi:hypothetical protein